MHLLAEYGGHDSFLGQRVKNQPLQGTMRHGPSGCQGVPNRPEIREAATTLRVQCETLDQPAALAAYLNPLLKEAGLTKPTAAHPSGGPAGEGRELLTLWGDERVRSLSHRGAVSFKARTSLRRLGFPPRASHHRHPGAGGLVQRGGGRTPPTPIPRIV